MFIYYLHKNGLPFYIGKTNNISIRYYHHKKKYGDDIFIEVLDIVCPNEWIFWEKWWISIFKSWGFKLENKNKGGGGVTFQSTDTKLKISNNTSRKEKISIAHKGKYIGRKASWSKGLSKGYKYSEEAKIKMRKPRINKWTRDKMFSPGIVEQIKEKYNNGYTKAQLSREYNVSWGTVKNIVTNRY